MNTKILKELVQSSLEGTLKFPDIVGKLIAENIESYHADLVRGENRYYSPTGESHVEALPFHHPKAAEKFSASLVSAAIKSSQAGTITYQQFLNQISAAGTVYYIVYITGKQVIYFGREGDYHTEKFPQSK